MGIPTNRQPMQIKFECYIHEKVCTLPFNYDRPKNGLLGFAIKFDVFAPFRPAEMFCVGLRFIADRSSRCPFAFNWLQNSSHLQKTKR